MGKNNGGGGGKFTFKGILSVAVMLGILGAFYQIPADPSVKGVWANIQARAAVVKVWAANAGDRLAAGDLSLGIRLNVPKPIELAPKDTTKADVTNLTDMLNKLRGGYIETAAYDRAEWKHWDNVTSCWTVREEVLYRDAVDQKEVTLLDRDKQPTDNKGNACYITGGTWIDPYTKEKFTNPDDLDIDHVIPLSYANKAGGYAWDGNKKQDYANYLTYDHHLLAVSATANRSKGDKGPADWKPENKAYWCSYSVAWTKIADKWNLALRDVDKKALVEMLGTCVAN